MTSSVVFYKRDTVGVNSFLDSLNCCPDLKIHCADQRVLSTSQIVLSRQSVFLNSIFQRFHKYEWNLGDLLPNNILDRRKNEDCLEIFLPDFSSDHVSILLQILHTGETQAVAPQDVIILKEIQKVLGIQIKLEPIFEPDPSDLEGRTIKTELEELDRLEAEEAAAKAADCYPEAGDVTARGDEARKSRGVDTEEPGGGSGAASGSGAMLERNHAGVAGVAGVTADKHDTKTNLGKKKRKKVDEKPLRKEAAAEHQDDKKSCRANGSAASSMAVPRIRIKNEEARTWEDVPCSAVGCDYRVTIVPGKTYQNRRKYQAHLLNKHFISMYSDIPESARLYQCTYTTCRFSCKSNRFQYLQHIAFKHKEWYKRINKRLEAGAVLHPSEGEELEELIHLKNFFLTDYRVHIKNVPSWFQGISLGCDDEPQASTSTSVDISKQETDEQHVSRQEAHTKTSLGHDKMDNIAIKSPVTDAQESDSDSRGEFLEPEITIRSSVPPRPVTDMSEPEKEKGGGESSAAECGSSVHCSFCSARFPMADMRNSQSREAKFGWRQEYRKHLVVEHFRETMYPDVASADSTACSVPGCSFGGQSDSGDIGTMMAVHRAVDHQEFEERLLARLSHLKGTLAKDRGNLESRGEIQALTNLMEVFQFKGPISTKDGSNSIDQSLSDSSDSASGDVEQIISNPSDDSNVYNIESGESSDGLVTVEGSESENSREDLINSQDRNKDGGDTSGNVREGPGGLTDGKQTKNEVEREKGDAEDDEDLEADDSGELDVEEEEEDDELGVEDEEMEEEVEELGDEEEVEELGDEEDVEELGDEEEVEELGDEEEVEEVGDEEEVAEVGGEVEAEEEEEGGTDGGGGDVVEKDSSHRNETIVHGDSSRESSDISDVSVGKNATISKCKGCGMVYEQRQPFLVHIMSHFEDRFKTLPVTPSYHCPEHGSTFQLRTKFLYHQVIQHPDTSPVSKSEIYEFMENKEIEVRQTRSVAGAETNPAPDVKQGLFPATQEAAMQTGKKSTNNRTELAASQAEVGLGPPVVSSTEDEAVIPALDVGHEENKVVKTECEVKKAGKVGARATGSGAGATESGAGATGSGAGASGSRAGAGGSGSGADLAYSTWTCKGCSKTFATEETLRTHIISEHLQDHFKDLAPLGKRIYTCSLCHNHSTTGRVSYTLHLATVHQVIDDAIVSGYIHESRAPLVDIDVIGCTSCPALEFRGNSELRDHIVSTHFTHRFRKLPKRQDEYRCHHPGCNFLVKRRRFHLIRHLVNVHSEVTNRDIDRYTGRATGHTGDCHSGQEEQEGEEEEGGEDEGADDMDDDVSSIGFSDSVSQAPYQRRRGPGAEVEAVPAPPVFLPLNCPVPSCRKKIQQQANLEDHLETHGIRQEIVFQCQTCSFATNFAQLYHHLTTFHRKTSKISNSNNSNSTVSVRCLCCDVNLPQSSPRSVMRRLVEHTLPSPLSTHPVRAASYRTSQSVQTLFHYSCNLCFLHFQSADELTDHGTKYRTRCYVLSRDPSYMCHLCNFSKAASKFSDHCRGTRHHTMLLQDSIKNKTKYGLNDLSQVYSCDTCNIASNYDNIVEHFKTGRCNKLSCGACDLQLAESGDLQLAESGHPACGDLSAVLGKHVLTDTHIKGMARFAVSSNSDSKFKQMYSVTCISCLVSFKKLKLLRSHTNCPKIRFRCNLCSVKCSAITFGKHLMEDRHQQKLRNLGSAQEIDELPDVVELVEEDGDDDVEEVVAPGAGGVIGTGGEGGSGQCSASKHPPSPVRLNNSPPRKRRRLRSESRDSVRELSPPESVVEIVVAPDTSFSRARSYEPSVVELSIQDVEDAVESIEDDDVDDGVDDDDVTGPVQGVVVAFPAPLAPPTTVAPPRTSPFAPPTTTAPLRCGVKRHRNIQIEGATTRLGNTWTDGSSSRSINIMFVCSEPCQKVFTNPEAIKKHAIKHDNTRKPAKIECKPCKIHLQGGSVARLLENHFQTGHHKQNLSMFKHNI